MKVIKPIEKKLFSTEIITVEFLDFFVLDAARINNLKCPVVDL